MYGVLISKIPFLKQVAFDAKNLITLVTNNAPSTSTLLPYFNKVIRLVEGGKPCVTKVIRFNRYTVMKHGYEIFCQKPSNPKIL